MVIMALEVTAGPPGLTINDGYTFLVSELDGSITILLGLGTRFVAVPFLIEMMVAMLSTKIGLYLGTSPLPLPPSPPLTDFWAVLHEVRSEYAQLLTVSFLLCVGPGPWSLDALVARKRSEHPRSARWADVESEARAAPSAGTPCEPAMFALVGIFALTFVAGLGRWLRDDAVFRKPPRAVAEITDEYTLMTGVARIFVEAVEKRRAQIGASGEPAT
jgi:uncharacterized membrane protein YphA (DoxX/SURF4 family)